MLHAIIGIGSSSVRLLIADVTRGALIHRHRDRDGTRLFDGLENGALSEASMQYTIASVSTFAAHARAFGDVKLHIMATSATRDASNREEFAARVLAETGIVPEILSGEQEAYLSFLGGAQQGYAGLIDIGGGSTEMTVGKGLDIHASVSLQLGGVRLMKRYAIHSAADLPALRAYLDPILCEGWQRLAVPKPENWTGVGGTLTTLAAIDKQLASFDRTLVEGHVLTRKAVTEWLEAMADMPLAIRQTLPGLQPRRADIVVHGVAILEGCMRALHLPAIRVSDHGNLDGYLRRLQLQLPVDR